MKPRFLQVHTLHSYPAALLNRDDSGLAKRMAYGGTIRTRISSQCLKRHWRTAEGEHAWRNMDDFVDSVRSREVVTKEVIARVAGDRAEDDPLIRELETAFQIGVYGEKGTEAKSRQPLLLGAPEVSFLRNAALDVLGAHTDPKALRKAADEFFKDQKANIGAMRESTKLPGGLASALFGRMVTSDTSANIDASIHVAHALTVHAEESESDYFTVVDDLQGNDEDAGAAHIGDTELTSGLFYGYVVVDLPALVSNLEGVESMRWADDDVDRSLASEVVRRLIYLIATVTPGAKLGSTAPYAWAPLVLAELGNRQPRSLAGAFRSAVAPTLSAAETALAGHLVKLDAKYGPGESRLVMSLEDACYSGAEPMILPDLAAHVAATLKAAST